MFFPNASRRILMTALAAAALASPAAAQSFAVKFHGVSGQQLRGTIAIPAYQISYYTQHQGTASGGVLTKARLTTTLAGVDAAAMRQLADEAYEDLRVQLQAAGIAVTPQADIAAAVAASGVELAPGNADASRIGPGITIGADVKKAHAAFGAKDAPMIKGMFSPVGIAGLQVAGSMASLNKLGPVAKSQRAVLILPHLVIDFADSSAKGGSDFLGRASASASSKMRFTLSMMSSASVLSASPDGRFVTPGGLHMSKDAASPAPFGAIETGAGAVRALSIGTVTDSNYIQRDSSRGDAAVVDKAAWTELVRDAYRSFNGAIVAQVRKAQGT